MFYICWFGVANALQLVLKVYHYFSLAHNQLMAKPRGSVTSHAEFQRTEFFITESKLQAMKYH